VLLNKVEFLCHLAYLMILFCMLMCLACALTEFSNALDAGIYVVFVLVSMQTDTLFQNSMQLGSEYDTLFPVSDADFYEYRDTYSRSCHMRTARCCCCVCVSIQAVVCCRKWDNMCAWADSIFGCDCCD
jgi:hypothetical protein